jgi:hypothetical protein
MQNGVACLQAAAENALCQEDCVYDIYMLNASYANEDSTHSLPIVQVSLLLYQKQHCEASSLYRPHAFLN